MKIRNNEKSLNLVEDSAAALLFAGALRITQYFLSYFTDNFTLIYLLNTALLGIVVIDKYKILKLNNFLKKECDNLNKLLQNIPGSEELDDIIINLSNFRCYYAYQDKFFGKFDEVRTIIESAASSQAENQGVTLLHMAVRHGAIDIVENLLSDPKCDVLAVDENCESALDWARSLNNHESIRLIVEKYEELKLNYELSTITLLLLRAIETNNIEVIQLCLDYDPNLANADCSGKSPLHYAVATGDLESVQLLFDYVSDHSKRTVSGETPMHFCAKGGFIDIAEYLLRQGASINPRNSEGQTPLMWAAEEGCEEFVMWLLKNNVEHDMICDKNLRAIGYARKNNNVGIQNLLLDVRAKGNTFYRPKVKTLILDQDDQLRIPFNISFSALTIDFQNKLGAGRTCNVYKAKYNFSEVAVKYLHPLSSKSTDSIIHNLKSESIMMGQLRHPNIVSCFGFSLDKGCYGLVMELMPEGSLDGLLKSTNNIPWKDLAQIAADISSGLAYLHSQNIIHRDLKSKNILLDGALRAKISDFGTAIINDETQSTEKVGTVRWMAPEVVTNNNYTFASDVYSLGWVLWEIITRESPYPRVPDDQVIEQIRQGNREEIPTDVLQELEKCPLEEIIHSCWEINPTKRQTSPEISETLTSWYSFFQKQPLFTSLSNKSSRILDEIREIKKVQGVIIPLLLPQPQPPLSLSL